MPEGFETRTVVDAPGISGQANQPSRQLGLGSVGAPRGGGVSKVGDGIRALSEMTKLGGIALNGYLERKDQEATTAIELAHAAGTTLDELETQGIGNPTKNRGIYQSLDLQSSLSKWEAHTGAQMDPSADPVTFQAGLQSDVADMTTNLPPALQRLAADAVVPAMKRLTKQQAAVHAKWQVGEDQKTLTNVIMDTALAGDVDTTIDMLDNLDAISPGLPDDTRRTALTNAVTQTLMDGSFLALEAAGGLDGLRTDHSLDSAQLSTVRNALTQAQILGETANWAEITSAVEAVEARILARDISPAQGVDDLEVIQEQMNLSDGTTRAFVRTAVTASQARDATLAKIGLSTNPEYIEGIAANNRDTALGLQTSTQAAARAKQIALDAGVPAEQVLLDMTAANAVGTQFQNQQTASIRKKIQDTEYREQEDTKAQLAIQSDSIHALDGAGQQRAMHIRRTQIMESTDDPVEQIVRHVGFLRTTAVVDDYIKDNFTEANAVSPIGGDGKITEAAADSLDYFLAMRQGGLSEQTIREYTGDGYEYMATAAFLQNGSLDVSKSMLSAFEVTRTDKDQRETPRTKVEQVRKQIGKDMKKFFDNIEPSMFASWTGAASDAKYDEVLTSEVKEAAKNSDDMRVWAERRAETYAETYPDMRPDAVSSLVQKDLSRWEYVFGKMVPPKNGQSLSEMMGIEDLPEALSTNSAVLYTLHTRMDELAPEGSDTRGVLTQFFDTLGAETLEALLAPEKFLHSAVSDEPFERGEGTLLTTLGQVALAPINAIEARQRILKNLVPVDITPYGNGILLMTLYRDTDKTEPVGTPIPINAKIMGADYRHRED